MNQQILPVKPMPKPPISLTVDFDTQTFMRRFACLLDLANGYISTTDQRLFILQACQGLVNDL